MKLDAREIEQSLVPADMPCKSTQSCELKGNRWYVQNYCNEKELHVSPNNIHESIYLENCCGSNIYVDSKVNAVEFSKCSGCNVFLPDVISSVSLVHCTNVKIQLNGACGTVVADHCDGVTAYLVGEESKKCQFHTSHYNNVKIIVDDRELVIPNLWLTTFCPTKKTIKTVPHGMECDAIQTMNE